MTKGKAYKGGGLEEEGGRSKILKNSMTSFMVPNVPCQIKKKSYKSWQMLLNCSPLGELFITSVGIVIA